MNIKNFTLLVLFSLFISQLSAQNLVLNGDFETWEDASTPSEYYKAEDATQESIEVHSGSYSVMHVGGTSDIAQAIGGIEAGAEYTLSLWYKVGVEGDGSDARIWSYWLDGSSTISDNAAELRGPNNSYLTNSSDWTKYETIITAPADADSFRFEVRTYSGATVYWDDLSLVKNGTIPVAPTLPYMQDFATDLGDFDTTSVVGTQGWYADSYNDDTYAKISGYSGGNQDNDDYLISPTFDFTDYSNVELSFAEAIKYISSYEDLMVLVSTDYAGDITTANFDTLDITNRGTGNSYDFVTVDPIDLSAYDGMPDVTIIFAYHSTTDGAATWELKDVMLSEAEPVVVAPTLPYMQDFATDLGDFDTTSVVGSQGWYASSYNDDTYAKISGYSGGNQDNDDYLISPTFDFTDYSNVELTFTEAIKYISSYEDLMVLVSTDYAGDITTADFDTLDITNRGTGNSYDFVTVDPIDLSAYDGMPDVTIIFAYHSTTDGAATWEVKDVMLSEAEPVVETPMLPYVQTFEEDFDDFTTFSEGGDQAWSWTSSYGAKMSGYSGGAQVNKDYLISPAFSFENYVDVVMTFSEAVNYQTDFEDYLQLLVSTDYAGDISTATFDTLEVRGRASGDSWNFVTTDTIDLEGYQGAEMVTFFFAYESTTDFAATWEINNITISGVDTSIVVPSNHVTDFVASSEAVTDTSITLIWTENDGEIIPEGYLITATTGDLFEVANGMVVANDTVLTDGTGAINVLHGETSYTFSNCQPGTEYTFAIYPYLITDSELTYKIADAPMVTIATLSNIAAPVILTAEGEYIDSVVVEIVHDKDFPIYYTLDGTIPTEESIGYYEPFTLYESDTVYAIAIKDDTISAISSAYYEVVTPVEVSNLAELRAGATDGTVYRLTGDAIVTMALEYKNQKFIQDNSAAIMIYDVDGMIPNDYVIGDGITSVTGTLTDYNGLLELIPVADAKVSLVEFMIIPQELSVDEFNANFEDYESELITLTSVEMNATGAFENGTNYELFDDSDTTVLRTHFYGMDYIGTDIPTGLMLNVTGIAICYYETTQLVPRMADDIEIIISAKDIESSASIYSFENVIYVNNIQDSKATIEIYSMDGRIVKSMRTVNVSEKIRVYDKGIYIVALKESSGRTKYKRVLIK